MKRMYVMIPVRKETKDLVEAYKKSIGAKSYDEALSRSMAQHQPTALEVISSFAEHFPEGLGPFVRDKSERNFDRYLRDTRTG